MLRFKRFQLIFSVMAIAPLGAMDLHYFHRMTSEDQTRCIDELIDGGHAMLENAGRIDLSKEMTRLFNTNAPDVDISIALLEVESNLFDHRRWSKIASVEQAFAQALKVNGVILPQTFTTALVNFKIKSPLNAKDTDDDIDWDGFIAGLKKEAAAHRNAVPARPPGMPPSPATPTAALPPPTAPPPPPPAAPPPPDDDPIGGGGFIVAPSTYNVLLCIPQNLVDKYSFTNPDAGSKMETFKNLAANYIFSVAKPGWQYWIADGQFERFNPASVTKGDKIVSQISPDSGRFDEFNPRCPANTAGFTIAIRR
jgi:hypothetical protein